MCTVVVITAVGQEVKEEDKNRMNCQHMVHIHGKSVEESAVEMCRVVNTIL